MRCVGFQSTPMRPVVALHDFEAVCGGSTTKNGRSLVEADTARLMEIARNDLVSRGIDAKESPLPPEVFTTQEVEQVRPAIRDASRDWNLLDADFRQRLLLVYKIMHDEHGYDMALLEGYRSPDRQAKLAAMGSNVTQATALPPAFWSVSNGVKPMR